ncbi:MAG TPA: PAS domain-containing protein, partial [Allosphingosinicella sp.]|nr:PAS domain-containing protein [Allosphingosinicella sp.]
MNAAVASRRTADVALFGVAALASAALLLWAVRDPTFALVFLGGLLGTGGLLLLVGRKPATAVSESTLDESTDMSVLRMALDSAGNSAALAVTDHEGGLICANGLWGEWFGAATSPRALGEETEVAGLLRDAARDARRHGNGQAEPVLIREQKLVVDVRSVDTGDRLLWRFIRAEGTDIGTRAQRLIASEGGKRLGEAGVMAVVTGEDGQILAANAAFAQRAGGDEPDSFEGIGLAELLTATESGQFSFVAEGKEGPPLRIIQVPAGGDGDESSVFLMMDDLPGARIGEDENAHIHALLDILPLGLALADTDGRFTFLNKVFRRTVGLSPQERPAWPGDLVVDEDKAAVSDAVRRFARGRALSGDLAVRLRLNPEEPVAMTVAGARGLGSAAVLLSLKDNSEEARLKREIAQATKMQAVGQLAGGVAHDFNNILTAILGTCDLMLMRHTPGDSDYDDIQQIRSNSNRAASLTRQLLAFSRQQTLRPQVLQLPDVVAEVSHLLTRLLGERVRLQVKHGRGLGAVRADPGQLEQV